MTNSNTVVPHASGLAAGLVIGIAIGAWLDDLAIGVSLGLLLGSSVDSYFEYKSGRKGPGWAAIGAGAFVWVLAVTLYTRT